MSNRLLNGIGCRINRVRLNKDECPGSIRIPGVYYMNRWYSLLLDYLPLNYFSKNIVSLHNNIMYI